MAARDDCLGRDTAFANAGGVSLDAAIALSETGLLILNLSRREPPAMPGVVVARAGAARAGAAAAVRSPVRLTT